MRTYNLLVSYVKMYTVNVKVNKHRKNPLKSHYPIDQHYQTRYLLLLYYFHYLLTRSPSLVPWECGSLDTSLCPTVQSEESGVKDRI